MSSVYENWISANLALFSCYENVSTEQYNALTDNEKSGLCKNEQTAVAAFLKDDKIAFRNLIAARLATYEQHH